MSQALGHGRLNGCAIAVASLTAALACALSPVSSVAAVSGKKFPAAHSQGSWSVNCPLVRRAPDDPIVYPGGPGLAHSHDFYGNPSTDAFSTHDSLLSTPTECDVAADHSAYWIPTLRRVEPDGTATDIEPGGAKLYYRAAGRNPDTIKPFPRGLEIIAGNQHSTGDQNEVEFWCGTVSGVSTNPNPAPPDCPSNQYLIARIAFPDCSNGDADSTDHKSHMADSRRLPGDKYRTCPPSHPIPVPKLSMTVFYAGTAGADLAYSSGGSHSLHADFFEAWADTAVRQLIKACLRADYRCERPRVTTTDEGSSGLAGLGSLGGQVGGLLGSAIPRR